MKVFDYSLVKNPQYFKDGRMDAHSDHTYYRDGEEAKEKETFILILLLLDFAKKDAA